MKFTYNDGGRKASHFIGGATDCVARAVAIVTDTPYLTIRNEILAFAPLLESQGVETGTAEFQDYMKSKGFVFIPAGGNYSLFKAIPQNVKLIATVSHHYTAVLDGEINDIIDCRSSILKGYWLQTNARLFDLFDEDGKRNLNPVSLAQAIRMRNNSVLNYRRILKIVPHYEQH